MPRRVRLVERAGLRLNMKMIPSLAVLTALVALEQGNARLGAAEEEGVALAIIYDTSGSMRETVPNATGGSSPKYVIANRALMAIAKQIQAFATNSASGATRKYQYDSAGRFTTQIELDHLNAPIITNTPLTT